jgi:hypothetical protein
LRILPGTRQTGTQRVFTQQTEERGVCIGVFTRQTGILYERERAVAAGTGPNEKVLKLKASMVNCAL